MRQTPLRKKGVSEVACLKRDIQATLREIAMLRDGTCILRKYRSCTCAIYQFDHLITRANSATYADYRLGVLVCRDCHYWKEWNKEEYDALVKTILPKDRVDLWERADEARFRGYRRMGSYDWKLELAALQQELRKLKEQQDIL